MDLIVACVRNGLSSLPDGQILLFLLHILIPLEMTIHERGISNQFSRIQLELRGWLQDEAGQTRLSCDATLFPCTHADGSFLPTQTKTFNSVLFQMIRDLDLTHWADRRVSSDPSRQNRIFIVSRLRCTAAPAIADWSEGFPSGFFSVLFLIFSFFLPKNIIFFDFSFYFSNFFVFFFRFFPFFHFSSPSSLKHRYFQQQILNFTEQFR